MTGYLLRNAEYVMAVRRVVGLKTRSLAEYRDAFDRIDLDRSGYIEVGEIENLLGELYADGVPEFEISSFLSLFDTDGDQRISWEEFKDALGGKEDDPLDERLEKRLEDAADDERTDPDGRVPMKPEVSGTVKVQIDGNKEVEVDAAAYMEELAKEAQALREELNAIAEDRTNQQEALASSISAYVSSLPENQLKVLSSGISDDVVGAMKQLVQYILRAPSGDGPLNPEEQVTMEQEKLQALCLYQLVLGYRLREAEATGEAKKLIG